MLCSPLLLRPYDLITETAQIFPLDVMGTMPIAAYGTKKLRAAYNGSAIRVRRTSDAAELDIGFVGLVLNIAALDIFIAGTTGTIVTWYDQSGNNNHAAQAIVANQPSIGTYTIRNTRAIHFDGATSKLILPAGVATNTQALTIFVSGSPTAYQPGGAGLIELGADFWFYEVDALVTNSIGGTGITHYGQADIVGLRYSATAQTIFSNDQTFIGGAPAAVAKVGGTIGSLVGAGGFFMHGNLTSVIIYARSLSDNEFTAGRASMNGTFNIPPTTTKKFFADGDSLWTGYNSGDIATPQMAIDQWPVGLRLVNISAGGSLIANLTTTLTPFGPMISAAPCIVGTNGGTNDISATADSAAVIWARLQTFCSTARGLGAKVIISTLLPSTAAGYTAPRLVEMDALNILIRNNWPANADAMIDYAAHPTMGLPNAPNNVALYVDQVHPTAYGQSLLLPLTVAALRSLT